MSGINRQAFNSSTFPPILIFFLKDPGPLKSIKCIRAAKQLFMCSDRIMWPPGSKSQYRTVFSRNRLDCGRCSPGILVSKLYFELILRVSRQRVMFTRYRVDSGSTHCLFLQIPGCILPLSYLLFSRFLMCPPAIDRQRDDTSKITR